MTFQSPRRERASSDRAQEGPVVAPQRPGLQNRTFSAPVGGLYKLDSSRTAMEGGNKIGRTVIEEDESPNGRTPVSPQAWNTGETFPKPDFPHVTIAVVGGDHVGKTTFIRSALDMKHTLSSRSTTKKMSLDGSVYLVRLLEIASKQIFIGSNGAPVWPRFGTDPTIDGVLVLHDATRPATFSETTSLLATSSLPCVLVASKCDLQNQDGPLDPDLGNYEMHRTSPESPRSQKMCIALVLRSVIANKYDLAVSYQSHINRQLSGDPSQNPAPAHDHWHHHVRANSENPTAVFNGAAGGPATTSLDQKVDGSGESRYPTDQNDNLDSSSQSSRYARSNSHPVRPQTPSGRLNHHKTSGSGDNSPIRDLNRQQRLHNAWRNSSGSDVFNSFLDMEDENDGSPRSVPSSPDGRKDRPMESVSNETGFTFDELVDRLVAQPMSKQDTKFESIFLCLYRKFAAPASLLNALINRFERNERNISDQLTRIADQLRLLNVISQWVSEYPGDVAYPKTRQRITDFASKLEKSPFYMFAAKEISSYLEINAEDDDIGWPYGDGDVEEFSNNETFLVNPDPSSPSMFLGEPSPGEDEDEEEEDPIYNMSALDLSEGPPETASRLSGTLSISSTMEKPGTIMGQSFTILNIDTAQREAQNLELTPRVPLSKLQWRQFMEIPDEDFARELTRIDWIMYNSFRPRDLVRHVSISGPDKDKIQSLKHVNRMIKQFNHLAFFVASMTLFRDKPKHRARAMEKFMNIAQKLRRLNNYNSLGAVIAGINGTPVHRLSQTREQVPVQVQKDFMRLVILMGTQKSHFAYRLAWDNSFQERIPFLPLHRRDLVSAEEGNKTFVGDSKTRINWKKFEVMGEVVLGIQRSQKMPYSHMPRYDEAMRFVLDMKLSGDEEDLYARSMQVEPSAGGDTGRKKFGWLRY
ncbi:hypothetical protein MW887_010320 [Aspergillus wentii]|nr:hypothetical protein MW887_010320 [Aspergillus wentii]